jgi:hypothetical protein
MRSATDEFILRELAEGGGWPYTGKPASVLSWGSTDSLKNRAAAVLANNGIAPYSDLLGPSGLRFLQQLELREPPRRQLDSMLTQHDPPHGTCAYQAGASESSGELVSCQWPLRPTRAKTVARLTQPRAPHAQPGRLARSNG